MNDANVVLERVAEAAALEEGAVGVREILRAVAELEPAPVRSISRRTGIAVPVVAATLGELRSAHLVAASRPARLTEAGRRLAGGRATADDGHPLPSWLVDVAARLAVLEGAPPADPALDQSHCTLATRLRRVALLYDLGLAERDLLLLGDDDLVSVALAAASDARRRAAGLLTVVDVDQRVLDVVTAQATVLGAEVECVRHDLREPLPSGLVDTFDGVFTDVPYTVEGATLFLSRAAQALRAGPGRDVFWCFGPKGPDTAVRAQEAVVGMGFEIQRLERNFNDYVGAGVLGSTSHLYHLRTSTTMRPRVVGSYDGPLYTRECR